MRGCEGCCERVSSAGAAVRAAVTACVLLEAALVGYEGGCNSNCDILHRSRVGQKPIRGLFEDPSGMTASSLCLQQAFFEFTPYVGGAHLRWALRGSLSSPASSCVWPLLL